MMISVEWQDYIISARMHGSYFLTGHPIDEEGKCQGSKAELEMMAAAEMELQRRMHHHFGCSNLEVNLLFVELNSSSSKYTHSCLEE